MAPEVLYCMGNNRHMLKFYRNIFYSSIMEWNLRIMSYSRWISPEVYSETKILYSMNISSQIYIGFCLFIVLLKWMMISSLWTFPTSVFQMLWISLSYYSHLVFMRRYCFYYREVSKLYIILSSVIIMYHHNSLWFVFKDNILKACIKVPHIEQWIIFLLEVEKTKILTNLVCFI